MLMRGLLRHFRRDKNGLAAVEFALILPAMLVLFFGVTEVSQMLDARAAVTNIVSVTADLVAQKSTVTQNDVSEVFGAAKTMLYPHDATAAHIKVSSIVYDTVSKSLTSGKVAWSCAKHDVPRNVGDTVTLPEEMMTVGGSVIVSEITYDYSSPVSKLVVGAFSMKNTFYTKPRRVMSISGPAANSCTTT